MQASVFSIKVEHHGLTRGALSSTAYIFYKFNEKNNEDGNINHVSHDIFITGSFMQRLVGKIRVEH